jgi:hypothetical protein
VEGAAGQTAALQIWRDGEGDIAALITPEGATFVRQMGVNSELGGTVANMILQVDGVNRFALSAFETTLNFGRYDDLGTFKDTPVQLLRNGNLLVNIPVEVSGEFVELAEETEPTTPNSGRTRLFLDEATGDVSVKRSNGTVVSLEQGGAGDGVTVRESDGTPSVGGADTIEFNPSDGFTVSDQGGGTARVGLNKRGAGTQVQMTSGAVTTDDCAKFNSAGDLVSAGSSCGSGSANPPKLYVVRDAGVSQGGIASTGWHLPSAGSPLAYDETNPLRAVLRYGDSSDECAETTLRIPPDWDAEDVEVDLWWETSSTNTGQSVAFEHSFACQGSGESWPGFGAAAAITSAPLATANLPIKAATVQVSLSACAADDRLQVRICRDVSDTLTAEADLASVRWGFGR